MSELENHPKWWHGLVLSFINLLMKIGFGALLGDKAAKYSSKFRYRATGLIADKAFHNNQCPQCGGTLARRKGTRGKFMGCSNYPNCKYTRNG